MLNLNESDFIGQYLKSYPNDVVIIAYKASWCSYCVQLSSEYNKLDKLLLNKVIVAEIDVDKNKNLIQKNNNFLYGYKVNGYPTIVIYKNGYFIKQYDGERKATKMIQEVLKFI